jgi:hypothetical protein
MRFRVDYLPSAERDVRSILRWLADRSPGGAASWYRICIATIDRLETSADTFSLAAENDDHEGREIREALFKTRRGRTFRIIFLIRGSVVSVPHVRSCDQDVIPPDELQFPDE